MGSTPILATMNVSMATARLLSQFVDVLNEHGSDSPEVQEFISQHQDKEPLNRLIQETLRLKAEYLAQKK